MEENKIFDKKVLLIFVVVITIFAIYWPLTYKKKDQFEGFFNTFGNKFLAGHDYNAKHRTLGWRLITPRKWIRQTMGANNLEQISTNQPTYWPSDSNKIPVVIDFCITKGIDTKIGMAEFCLDLLSDHPPVIVTIHSQILNKEKQPPRHNNRTDWLQFREILDTLITLNQPLKTEPEIEAAAVKFTTRI